MLSDLPEKIRVGKAVVSVLGLGRVGLPLAVVFARSGLRVIGVDVDRDIISTIGKGGTPFYYPVVQGWLQEVIGTGMFTASSASKESIDRSDVIVVTVGTPTGMQYQLDYTQLHSALHEIVGGDLRNKAIIMRSTSVPGTLSKIILPMLAKERAEA